MDKTIKIDAATFKKMLAESGGKTRKGRPVIDALCLDSMEEKDKGNRHVRGAKKVYDDKGNKLADSRWEYTCLQAIKGSGLWFEAQRKFLLLETRRSRGMAKTLRLRTWSPDFTFADHYIVADAKGFTTQIAKLKMHMFLDKYPEWDIYLLKNLNDLYNFINMLKRMEE